MKNRLQNRFFKNRFTRVDAAALLLFAAVWVYYIVTVRYGFCTPDESYSLNVAQRLAHGDRLLIDEWCPGQFFSIFLLLPYRVFLAINGSADGIILFSRYLFLAFNAAFFWTMYILLRRYRWSALAASLLFSLYVPMNIFSCSYYPMVVRLLMLVCLLLLRDRKTPLSMLLAGVLLSGAVLNQPGLAFLYVGFTVLVWLRFFRQKKGKPFLDDFSFCLETRTWTYMTVSVLVCAAVFLTWLVARSGFQNVFRFMPYLFTDPEYDYSAGGNARGFFLQKLLNAAQAYGLYCVIPALLIVILSVLYACGLPRAKRETVRRVLFALSCAVWVLSCVPSFCVLTVRPPDNFFFFYPVPMFWFGFVCYLLGSKQNKRLLFFWTVSLCASLCVDFFSDIALSIGAPISCIADLIFFVDLVRELRPEQLFKKRADRRKKHADARRRQNVHKPAGMDTCILWCVRLTCVCFALWIGFICTFENTAFPEHLALQKPLYSLPHVCAKGPWRSLHVLNFIGEDYEKRLADMDTVLARQPENLFVCGLTPDLYLYADLPYAAYSAWSMHEAPYLERQVEYWTLHPQRQPTCIYVPFYDVGNESLDDVYKQPIEEATLSWIRDALDPLCDYSAEQGQAGYILYVSQWRLPEE